MLAEMILLVEGYDATLILKINSSSDQNCSIKTEVTTFNLEKSSY